MSWAAANSSVSPAARDSPCVKALLPLSTSDGFCVCKSRHNVSASWGAPTSSEPFLKLFLHLIWQPKAHRREEHRFGGMQPLHLTWTSQPPHKP